ncbi:uncharacterized protein DKFZp434B061-like isoform X2 [Palaemon carinicauda]|uniref:uncharacterized protein DKFZp434B061-like isoform X2 n=1 Tax=Palaemon carinicauda TaxID=392227 RepID=UPI0035B6675A
MKVSRSAKKSAPTPGKAKRPILAGPLLVQQENVKPPNSTKLLITNLDHNVADSDICELFSEFGCIREVAVHYNCWGYSLGTAHVVFLDHENAAEAARRYNGVPFDGRPMTITLEGAPHGAHGQQNPLPVKMRLSFGPHNGRNPLSQLNAPTRGRPPKGVKRLENGPKGFGGLVKPRGRPAILGNGKSVGRLPTAAELDMELDEYLSQKRKKYVASQDKENDFGSIKDLATPYKSAKKNAPKGTPKTPALVNGKTPKRTPGRPPKTSPAGPSTETPKRTPGRPRKTSPTSSPTAAALNGTPGKSLKASPSGNSLKTPKRTPGRPPKVSPKGTPANHPLTTPFKVKLVRVPTKTPKKIEEEEAAEEASKTSAAAEEASKTVAATEEASKTVVATEEASEVLAAEDDSVTMDVAVDASDMLAAAEEASKIVAAAEEEASEALAAAKDKPEMEVEEVTEKLEDPAEEVEEIKPDVKETAASRTSRTARTPAKSKVSSAKNSGDTPSRRRLTRAPSKTPSKAEPPKKRKAAADETLEEDVEDVLEIEAAETLPDLPDLSKSPKKLSKRRSGRFAAN